VNFPSGLAATTPQQGMSLDRKERYCVAAPAVFVGAVPIFFPADGGISPGKPLVGNSGIPNGSKGKFMTAV